ncbi:hypothetical protein Save01_08345 [Streptomyces avermitilis]
MPLFLPAARRTPPADLRDLRLSPGMALPRTGGDSRHHRQYPSAGTAEQGRRRAVSRDRRAVGGRGGHRYAAVRRCRSVRATTVLPELPVAGAQNPLALPPQLVRTPPGWPEVGRAPAGAALLLRPEVVRPQDLRQAGRPADGTPPPLQPRAEGMADDGSRRARRPAWGTGLPQAEPGGGSDPPGGAAGGAAGARPALCWTSTPLCAARGPAGTCTATLRPHPLGEQGASLLVLVSHPLMRLGGRPSLVGGLSGSGPELGSDTSDAGRVPSRLGSRDRPVWCVKHMLEGATATLSPVDRWPGAGRRSGELTPGSRKPEAVSRAADS